MIYGVLFVFLGFPASVEKISDHPVLVHVSRRCYEAVGQCESPPTYRNASGAIQ